MININDLTLGQVNELKCLLGKDLPVPASTECCDSFAGKYVILRCSSAGVHAGVLVSQFGDTAVLKDSRRLWYWKCKSGIALSGVAQNGLADGCKVDSVNSLIRLTGVCETIICSNSAKESIHDYK